MKILFAVNCISGGASNVIQILSMYYQKQGHKVDLLLYDGIDVPSRYDLSKVNIIELPKLMPVHKMNSYSRIYNQIKSVRKFLRNEQPDIIISFLDNINTLTCFAGLNLDIPIIVSERNNTLMLRPKFPWDFLRKVAYKRADLLVVQCSIFAEFYKGIFKEKTTIIPNPIVDPNIKHEVKQHNGINLVTAGRLVDQKNFAWLIKVTSKIIERIPETHLTIYGRGSKEKELRDLIEEMGLQKNVTLAGYTTNVHEKIAQSDIYVMSSIQEGFPNSLCEAMAVGLPVVALKCHDGLTDIITHEENGYLVDLDNEDLFIETIIQLAQDNNKRKKIGENARRVAERYSENNIYKLWSMAIDKVMKGRNLN